MKLPLRKLILASALFSLSLVAGFAAPFEGYDLALEDHFDRKELGKGWKVQFGTFVVREGELHAAQKAEDNHAAAARRILETGDAVYELRFKLGEKTRALHFGFDPIRGALDKKGHLFSVIITPDSWKIMKHVDKNKPEEDPNEILSERKEPLALDTWHRLTVITSGTEVEAKIDGQEPLTASHPTFSVRKPTLVFRAIGEGIAIDDLKVYEPSKP